MEKWRGIIIIMTGLLLLSQHAMWGDKDRNRQLPSELSKVPPEAGIRKNPYDGKQDALQAGRKLFQRHCSGCHGKDARGGKDAPDLRSPAVRDATAGTIFWFLKSGDLKNGMPSWAKLPDQQLWQIVTYLKSKS